MIDVKAGAQLGDAWQAANPFIATAYWQSLAFGQ